MLAGSDPDPHEMPPFGAQENPTLFLVGRTIPRRSLLHHFPLRYAGAHLSLLDGEEAQLLGENRGATIGR